MSRVTAPPERLQFVRRMDLEIVIAARVAVEKAMEKLHGRNPARYHQDRPSLIECPFDSSCPFTASSTR